VTKFPSPIPAIVMAAGRDSEKFAAAGENPRRSLADINGQPMIAYVLQALQAAGPTGMVTVVAPPGFPDLPGIDRRVEASGTMVENVAAGLRACRDLGEAAFLTSADAPFLTPAAIGDFLDRAVASGAGLGYAVIARAVNDARFPQMHRTYARLAEGEFTGGNAFYVAQALWPGVERVLGQAHAARKKPWLLAHLLGPRILWRLLRHTLTIPEVEARISGLIGGPCRAILTSYAELGADVDDPADLAVARQLLHPPG
jgi:CTP:molybdopterin cytidylyltransferase MocA